jgi:branched-chain amino acid transport system substrate-binding protein
MRRISISLSVFFLAAASLSLMLAGCGGDSNAVRIAVAMPLTGDIGTEGQGVKRAVELAVEQANASGKFPFKLESRAFDDRADPKEAVNVANLIASDSKVIGVVGHYNSGCAIPSAPVYSRKGIPVVTPAATNPKLTLQQLEEGWTGPKNIFRVVPTDDVQGAYTAQFVVKKLKLKRFAIIHDKTFYGQGLAEEFKKNLEALGGTSLSFDGVATGDKDFKALLTRLRSTNPEGIYFGGLYPECGLLIKQGRELGLKAPFFSGDGSKTDGLFDVAGDAAEDSYFTITGIPVEYLPSAKAFVEAYQKKFPGVALHPYDHFGYEAANVILAALEKAGTPDRAKVMEALRTIKFDGVLGMTSFDEKGDTNIKTITMTRVKNKVFVPVE